MLNNVFEFNDKIVSEIMVPRTEVFALDKELTIKEVIDILSEDTRYSRVPVYEETIDNIVGIVYIKDILLSKKDENRKIKELMKKAYYVPETITVDKLFEEMRKKQKTNINSNRRTWRNLWNSNNGGHTRRNSRRNIR